MLLQEIVNYSHKIKKIIVHNRNTYSLMSEVITKITLTDATDNYTIRFSYNNEWLHHQSFDNDYYVCIPNVLKNDIEIYAHYFSADLYEYEETQEIYSDYDFRELYDFLETDQNEGTIVGKYDEEYTIQSKNNNYDYNIDEEGRLTIQSKLDNSIDNHKNPNYKNYNSQDENTTEQGEFPLSSRYRTHTNTNAPNLNNSEPKWNTTSDERDWEVRINRRGLSPLISNGVEDGQGNIIKDFPLNVYLDYEYTPTSTEYHQHFYGIEGEKQIEERNGNEIPKYVNILEGAKLNTINTNFGSKNNYRLINPETNIYDDSRSMYVKHGKIIPIDFNTFTPNVYQNKPSCEWVKNKCHNFWSFKSLLEDPTHSYCSKNVTNLQDGAWYSLKFFVYISATISNEGLPFSVEIKTNAVTYTDDDEYVEENFTIEKEFLEHDKTLKEQWIYHEIGFEATTNIVIKISGPETLTEYEDNIFFTEMYLEKMPRYSPTIKYTSRGVYVLDTDDDTNESHYTQKSLTEKVNTQEIIDEEDILWTPQKNKIPSPFSEVFINSNNKYNVYYEKETSIIYYEYIKNDDTLFIEYDKDDGWLKGNNNLITYDDETGWLKVEYSDILKKIKGPNNQFIINFTTTNDTPLNEGSAIATVCTKNRQPKQLENGTIITLSSKPVRNGKIIWNNVDLSLLPINNDDDFYLLKIEYTNECSYKKKVEYIKFILEEEKDYIQVAINNNDKNNINYIDTDETYIVDDPDMFPLKISAYISNQENILTDNGYAELSIDDELNQSTLMDIDGECDFYLDISDIGCGEHTIKIEYYRQYNKALAFIFFDINVTENGCDTRPRIPIIIKQLEDGKTKTIADNEIISCDFNDCMLFDITTGSYDNFMIKVIKKHNNVETVMLKENILTKNHSEFWFLDLPYEDIQNNNQMLHNPPIEYEYTVITTNMEDENGEKINNDYREYERKFFVSKHDDRYFDYEIITDNNESYYHTYPKNPKDDDDTFADMDIMRNAE